MEAAVAIDYKPLYEQEKFRADALEMTLSIMGHELAQLKKMLFGSRHERFIPDPVLASQQLTLDLAFETIATAAVTTETITKEVTLTKTTIVKKPVIHPGRAPLPAHLRREVTIVEPPFIPEGSKKMGEEVSEVLEYQPGEFWVNQTVRPRYVTPQPPQSPRTEIIIAPMPDRPLPKSIAGASLLAQIVVDKYVDHLPLYRQLQRFERDGVTLSDSTINGWLTDVCQLLMPLYTALKMEILQSGYIHVDETTIKVLDNTNKKGTTHCGYFWVYNNSRGRMVFFEYHPGRDAGAPAEHLDNFKGYLQTDGYVVYESYQQKENITVLNCMAHARRKFIEARKNDAVRSAYVLEQMQQLYAIERDCVEKRLTDDQKQAVRQQRAVPILDHLGVWMKEQYPQVLSKSAIGVALAYSIKRWDNLKVYTTNGMLCIDNNPVENSIRPVAIGRKNYMFAGSHEGAKRSAMLYSLLGTCKMNGVNPTIWLKDILIKLPSHPINKIQELLPHTYKPDTL